MQLKKVGPFWILKKLGANAYQIDLLDDLQISSTFNLADLTSFIPSDDAPTAIESLEDKFFKIGEELMESCGYATKDSKKKMEIEDI